MNYYDGQGMGAGSQGVPGPVETVSAPSGTDAAAMMALVVPFQSTEGGAPVDLGFQLPPDVRNAKQTPNCSTLGSQILVALVVALLVDWVVR